MQLASENSCQVKLVRLFVHIADKRQTRLQANQRAASKPSRSHRVSLFVEVLCDRLWFVCGLFINTYQRAPGVGLARRGAGGGIDAQAQVLPAG